MAAQNPNIKKIIKQLLSNPRYIRIITRVLIDILSQESDVADSMTNEVRKQPAPRSAKTTRKIEWNAKSAETLRGIYKYRKKHNKPIEPELNDALAKRFASYDAVQKRFTGHKGRPKSIPTHDFEWNAKSDDTLRAMHTYRKKRDMPIEPELNQALAKRFSSYDAVQKVFTGRNSRQKSKTNKTTGASQKSRLVRILNWADKSDDILRNAYKQHTKAMLDIDDALNAELARRFPNEYNPTTRTFIKETQKRAFAPRDTKKTTATKPAHLTVKLKPVKQSLGVTYNNVYVNGKLLLRNHTNTELKLFGDGTLLGAYGIVTNNKKMPQHPVWIIFDTNLVANKWAGNKKWARNIIYVTKILPTPNGLNLTLSNRRMIILENDKLKNRAGITRFEIQR